MANEIAFQAGLSITKNSNNVAGSGSLNASLSGNAYFAQIQTVGTTTEALDFGDVATPGYLFVKNTDPTNFVRIGLVTAVTSGNAMVTLLPGEFCFIPTRQTTIYAIADTGACDCYVVLTEL